MAGDDNVGALCDVLPDVLFDYEVAVVLPDEWYTIDMATDVHGKAIYTQERLIQEEFGKVRNKNKKVK